MWCDMCDQERGTLNSAQMCSLIRVAHVVLSVLVLVGVRRVTVVIIHIGHDEVVVVIHFFVAIFVVIFCIRRCTLYTPASTNLKQDRRKECTILAKIITDSTWCRFIVFELI